MYAFGGLSRRRRFAVVALFLHDLADRPEAR